MCLCSALLPPVLLTFKHVLKTKTRSKKAVFILGQSEPGDMSTSLFRVPERLWSAQAALRASVHPHMLLDNHHCLCLFISITRRPSSELYND